MEKKKYYAVKVGKTPGIYLTWEACKSQVDGVSGAVYKSFPTLSEAEAYVCPEAEVVVGAGDSVCPEADVGVDVSVCLDTDVDISSGADAGVDDRAGGSSQHDEQPDVPLGEHAAVAYVDGSYNVATKEYSCGIVFLMGTEEIHIAEKGESAELAAMRNVAGEILGAELAMRKAVELGVRSLSIYHDYQGIASWCLGEWKTNKEGTKAYKEYFDSIRDRINIRFVKVKGHSGDKYNDMADELAKSVIF